MRFRSTPGLASQLPAGWLKPVPPAARQFLRRYAPMPGTPSAALVAGSCGSLGDSREALNPSRFTIGTTITRARLSRPVIRGLLPNCWARSKANSMLISPEGHSRAWWTPSIRNTGLPSAPATPSLISTPRRVRPSSEGGDSVSGRTSFG